MHIYTRLPKALTPKKILATSDETQFMGKNVRDNLVYILLHVANDKSLNVFMQEKNEHRQRCSWIMECHRANISHKAVESHQSWILLYKCQRFRNRVSVRSCKCCLYVCSFSNCSQINTIWTICLPFTVTVTLMLYSDPKELLAAHL